MAAISATLMNIKTGTRARNLYVGGDDFRRELRTTGVAFRGGESPKLVPKWRKFLVSFRLDLRDAGGLRSM